MCLPVSNNNILSLKLQKNVNIYGIIFYFLFINTGCLEVCKVNYNRPIFLYQLLRIQATKKAIIKCNVYIIL